jgi:glutathione S-transferase
MSTLYHAPNTRSIRVLWTLEEIGVRTDVKSLPFPPRLHRPDYLSVNPTGTIPTFVDGDRVLAESIAICEYLAEKHGSPLVVAPGEPERPQFLQWLWYGESTLMAPLSVTARVRRMPKTAGGEVGVEAVLADARASLVGRLSALEERLEGRDFVAAGRLTLADISIGYPLHLVGVFGLDEVLGPRVMAYRERLRARPAYQKALTVP